jgi:DNA-binding transcriptional LysR family regulator
MHSLRTIDLNLLTILEAVLQERHVSRAAERLGMSQPAVSHALTRLRRQFGDELLVRAAPGGMRLTARAREIEADLAAALAAARRILAIDAFDPATAQRTFRLAMSDYGAMVLLPGLLQRLRTQAPGVRLAVTQASRQDMVAMVLDGEMDAAFGVFPQAPSALRVERLFTERFVCAADSAHPAFRGALTLEAYLAASHALVSLQGEPDGEIEAALAALGARRTVAVVVPHFSVAPSLVVGTDLILTVAERTLIGAGSRLAIRPPPFPVAPFDFTMIRHLRTDRDSAHLWFRDMLANTMADDAFNGQAC